MKDVAAQAADFHWPATLMYVSSIRQLAPTGRLRRWQITARTGDILMTRQ